jgi:hypothetical protein
LQPSKSFPAAGRPFFGFSGSNKFLLLLNSFFPFIRNLNGIQEEKIAGAGWLEVGELEAGGASRVAPDLRREAGWSFSSELSAFSQRIVASLRSL